MNNIPELPEQTYKRLIGKEPYRTVDVNNDYVEWLENTLINTKAFMKLIKNMKRIKS